MRAKPLLLLLAAVVPAALLVAGLVLLARLDAPESSRALPEPVDGRLVSAALPHSLLAVQSLEPEEEIDVDVVLRDAHGAVVERVLLEAVPPFAPRVVRMAELSGLPAGVYGAELRGSGAIGVVARHAWEEGVEESGAGLAMTRASAPARELILPYVALSGTAESAVLSIQAAEQAAETQVSVSLVPFGAEDGASAWEGGLTLTAGAAVSLDLARPGFEALDGAFRGFARITADGDVAASVLNVHVQRYGAGGMAALAALPAEGAAATQHAGFRTRTVEYFPNRPASRLALVNPLDDEVHLQLSYHVHPEVDRCSGELRTVSLSMPPRSGRLITHDETLQADMPVDCIGLVRLDAQPTGLVAATIFSPSDARVEEDRLYSTLPAAAAGAARRSLPWFSRWKGGEWRWLSASAYNGEEGAVTASLSLRDADGRFAWTAGLGDPETSIAGRSSHAWFLSGSQEDSQTASALIDHDGRLLVSAGEGARDAGDYLAIEVDSASAVAHVPFLARPPRWPTQPPVASRASAPTATPTPVTVEPPPPLAGPTLRSPVRERSVALQVGDAEEPEDWISCCSALAWTRADELWGVEFGDGVPLTLGRYDLATGAQLGRPERARGAERVRQGPDGAIYALDRYGEMLWTFDAQGAPTGSIPLRTHREAELLDVAAAADGSLWLVDNTLLEVHHLGPGGDLRATWNFREALRYPGDGGYRIALAPDGASIYVLSWTRLLRFAPDGRLLDAVGAPHFELSPEDFQAPMDLAVDDAGRVYVLEGTGRLRVYDPEGRRVAEWQAFGEPQAGEAWIQTAMALGPHGEIAVADMAAGAVHIYEPLSEDEVGGAASPDMPLLMETPLPAETPWPTERPKRGPFAIVLPWLQGGW